MGEQAKKQKLADFAKKLEDKDDWTKRNNALIEFQKLITDPEEPLKLTSREIIALRVALFQQIEDLRSTIVREACGLVSKMAELMPTEFEPSATMFLQVLLGRLHVSVKAMADATDSCLRALINHLPLKTMLPQIAQASKDLKNTILRRRCLEYILLMLQLHGAETVQPFGDVFDEVLGRALGDASLECRSTARDILHLYHEYCPERAVRVLQSIDRTVRKTLEQSFDVSSLLLSESSELTGVNAALNSSSGALNTITPDTPLSLTPTSVISPEQQSPASSPPSSPRSVRSVRSIQSAAPTTKSRDKPLSTPSRAVPAAKKAATVTATAPSTARATVKARPASVNLSSPKSAAPAPVSRTTSTIGTKSTPSKQPVPATSAAPKSKLSLAQVAKTTVTAKRAVTALTAKPAAKRLDLPSLKAPKSAAKTASTAPSSPVAAAPPTPVRAEDSTEVLALKLRRLVERTRRSIARDQLLVPQL